MFYSLALVSMCVCVCCQGRGTPLKEIPNGMCLCLSWLNSCGFVN